MKIVKQLVLSFLFLMVFWLLLNPVNQQSIIVGIAVAAFLAVLFIKPGNIITEYKVTPKSILFTIIYTFVFLWELIKSNLDVAFRVLHPKLPINPGIVKVKTRLKSKFGRMILANSITLTPGTLSVESRDEFLYIHWIDVTASDIDTSTQAIVANFEKYLEVMFG